MMGPLMARYKLVDVSPAEPVFPSLSHIFVVGEKYSWAKQWTEQISSQGTIANISSC